MKNKFNNSKIYKITNDVDDFIYIGSTTQRLLSDRMWKHSSSSMDPKVSNYNSRLYQHMREVGQFNFNMELVECYPCECKMELVQREQEWMDKYEWDTLLNQRRAVKK